MTISTPQVSGVKGDGSLSDLSSAFLKKNYLQGLEFVDADGDPIAESFYDQHLNTAVSQFERATKVRVVRRTIEDEAHDYIINDYFHFAFFKLFEYPVVSVEKVSAKYPTGQAIIDFPLEWVQIRKEQGIFNLVPTQGTLSQVIIGRGGSFLPLVYSQLGFVPDLFRISYTAGFEDGKIPFDIIDCIAKMAAIDILAVLGITVFPPGVTSVSNGLDGVSQSVGIMNSGRYPGVFGGTISAYRAEIFGESTNVPGRLKEIRDHYRGISMVVC